TVLYTVLWALVGFGLVFALFIRSDVELTVAPVRNPTFITLSDGSVRNVYDVRLRNKTAEAQTMRITAKGDPAIRVQLEGTAYQSIAVPADSTYLQRVYLVAPAGAAPAARASSDVRIWVEALGGGDRAYRDTTFNGRNTE
ncbi:MAG: FixG Ig-like domain-containing protein, partial [Pseudomonadota bacterium]